MGANLTLTLSLVIIAVVVNMPYYLFFAFNLLMYLDSQPAVWALVGKKKRWKDFKEVELN